MDTISHNTLPLPSYMKENVLKQILLEGFSVDNGGYVIETIDKILTWLNNGLLQNNLNHHTFIDKSKVNRVFNASKNISNDINNIEYIEYGKQYIGSSRTYLENEELDAIISKIHDEISSNNCFLFLSGFISHSICVYIQKASTVSYLIYIINSGSGIEYHPLRSSASSDELLGDVILKKTLDKTTLDELLMRLIFAKKRKNISRDEYYFHVYSFLEPNDFLQNEADKALAELPLQKSGTCAFYSVWYSLYLHLNLNHNVSKQEFLLCYDKIKVELIFQGLSEIISQQLYSPYVYNTVKIIRHKYEQMLPDAISHTEYDIKNKFDTIYNSYNETISNLSLINIPKSEPIISITNSDPYLSHINFSSDNSKSVKTFEQTPAQLPTINTQKISLYAKNEFLTSINKIKIAITFTKYTDEMIKMLEEIHLLTDEFKNALVKNTNYFKIHHNAKFIIVQELGKIYLQLFELFSTISHKYKYFSQDNITRTNLILIKLDQISSNYLIICTYTQRSIQTVTGTHGSMYIKSFHGMIFHMIKTMDDFDTLSYKPSDGYHLYNLSYNYFSYGVLQPGDSCYSTRWIMLFNQMIHFPTRGFVDLKCFPQPLDLLILNVLREASS